MWLFSSVVEQRPEEPCVPSPNLGGATKVKTPTFMAGVFTLTVPVGFGLGTPAKGGIVPSS